VIWRGGSACCIIGELRESVYGGCKTIVFCIVTMM
jgi:hypothetical protein